MCMRNTSQYMTYKQILINSVLYSQANILHDMESMLHQQGCARVVNSWDPDVQPSTPNSSIYPISPDQTFNYEDRCETEMHSKHLKTFETETFSGPSQDQDLLRNIEGQCAREENDSIQCQIWFNSIRYDSIQYSQSTHILSSCNSRFTIQLESIFLLTTMYRITVLTGATILPVWPTWRSLETNPASTAARDAPTAAPSLSARSYNSLKFSPLFIPRPPDTTILAPLSSGLSLLLSCWPTHSLRLFVTDDDTVNNNKTVQLT